MTDDPPVCEFAFPGPLRDALVGAVLAGTKTATSSLLAEWEHEGEEPPRPGDRQRVIDSAGEVVGVIEAVATDVVRLADVDDATAVAEGEDYDTAAGWRAAHERFWRDEVLPAWVGDGAPAIDDDTRVVVQRFRLVPA